MGYYTDREKRMQMDMDEVETKLVEAKLLLARAAEHLTSTQGFGVDPFKVLDNKNAHSLAVQINGFLEKK